MKLLIENWRKFLSEDIKIVIKKAKDLVCPPATQDLELNTKNRDSAVHAEHIQYGPLNVDEPGDYWQNIAEYWNTTEEAAKKSVCGNCVAFDISPRMKECMPGETSDEDGVLHEDLGDLEDINTKILADVYTLNYHVKKLDKKLRDQATKKSSDVPLTNSIFSNHSFGKILASAFKKLSSNAGSTVVIFPSMPLSHIAFAMQNVLYPLPNPISNTDCSFFFETK